VKLDAESATLALSDLDGVAVSAADLVEDRLAGEAGLCGGVGEAHVAGGDLGVEATAGVVGEGDAPGRVRCCLLGGQEVFAQPAADGLRANAEVSGSFVDRLALVGTCGAARTGGDVSAFANTSDARGGERQAGRGAVALFGEDHRDLGVRAVLGEAADHRHEVVPRVGAFGGRAVERDGELGDRAVPTPPLGVSCDNH
jgi:hypothetical protein